MAKTLAFARIVIWILPGACALRAQPSIIEYPVPTATSTPAGIVTGPDGNLWFTESDANKIAMITTSGAITEFAIPTPNSQPWAITSGPDGNLWFTEISGDKIGMITTVGAITEYPIPSPLIPGQVSRSNSIVTGPDGNLWFTEPEAGNIGKITPNGVITEYRTGPAGLTYPTSITVGPDGNMWFTGDTGVGQISQAGVVTQYPLIVGIRVDYLYLASITPGPDGSLWAVGRGNLWRISTSGVVASYKVETDFTAQANGEITAGPDRNLWFTDVASNKIARVTPGGVLAEYPIPTDGALVAPVPPGGGIGIAPGPDGNIWFTEQAANKIAKLVLSTVPADNVFNVTPSSLTFSSLASPNVSAPSQTLTVTASPSSAYTASTSTAIGAPWLTISPSGSLSGSQTFTVTLDPKSINFGAIGAYTADIAFVSGNVTEFVPVTLNLILPLGSQKITAVVNAASFAGGTVAPGEVVSIFGTSFGPASPLSLTLDRSGKVSKGLGGVSVDFNGSLAPVTYVSSTQINCVVPYEIAGSAMATVQVSYQYSTSTAFTLPLAETAPGVVTLNGSGSGQVAALDVAGGLNGPANPAPAGSLITFYLTGEGRTLPPSATGGVTTPNTSSSGPLTPQPRAAVNVTIGGKPAEIAFYGEAPGYVAGIMQLNVQIPDGLAAGSQPLVVSVGNAQSQSGVTVSVQ